MSAKDNALYRLSTTDEYHRRDLESLGWELTVSNSLYPGNTPIRKVLRRDAPYGDLLYSFLSAHVPMATITQVLEIGGGYGYLMKDLLRNNPRIRPSMLDISPALLKKQEETLAGHDVRYFLDNALEKDGAFFQGFDLVIFNENLGDFPTLADIDPAILDTEPPQVADDVVLLVRRIFAEYSFAKPAFPFNLNIGAIGMLEKVCGAKVPYVFIGEHSCEFTAPPDMKWYLSVSPTGNPRRISLKGHDEYTIKFSHLQTIAEHRGYRAKRGVFADFIEPDINDHVRAILASRGLYSDSGEIICQFISDLYEYEYLILMGQ